MSFLIIIWRLTFKIDAFSLNSTKFTRWAYPSNCIWFTCDHDGYVWLSYPQSSQKYPYFTPFFIIFYWPKNFTQYCFTIFTLKLYLWSRWICLCFKSFLKRNRSRHFVVIWTLIWRFDFFRVLRVNRIVILFVLQIIFMKLLEIQPYL